MRSSFGLGLLTGPQLQAWLQVDARWLARQVKNGVFHSVKVAGQLRRYDPNEVLRKVKAARRPKDGCWVCGGKAELCQEGRLTVRWCKRKSCGAVRNVRVPKIYTQDADRKYGIWGEGEVALQNQRATG